MAATKLWFIRHGEVESNYVGSFIGRTDVKLSDLGHHQAQAIAAYLEESPVDAILSSPRTRSQLTALPFSKQADLPITTVEGFQEMHFGKWEGKFWQEIVREDPDFAREWAADPTTMACPDGDSTESFRTRVHQALDGVLEEFAGRTVALFAHAGVNRAILSHILERPYLEMFRFSQDYGCINAAAVGPEARQVAMVNLVPGPRSHHNGDGGREMEESSHRT